MTEPTLRDEIVSALATAALLLDDDDANVEDAMLEASLALVWMRRLPGGFAARDRLKERLRAELERRKAGRGA